MDVWTEINTYKLTLFVLWLFCDKIFFCYGNIRLFGRNNQPDIQYLVSGPTLISITVCQSWQKTLPAILTLTRKFCLKTIKQFNLYCSFDTTRKIVVKILVDKTRTIANINTVYHNVRTLQIYYFILAKKSQDWALGKWFFFIFKWFACTENKIIPFNKYTHEKQNFGKKKDKVFHIMIINDIHFE